MKQKPAIPGMVPGRAILDFFERLEKKVDSYIEWGNEDGPEVRVARWCEAELLDCVKSAADQWEPTASAAAISEWSEDTLQKYARAVMAGMDVPAAWRGLEVRDAGNGYEFRLTTIPEKRRQVA